MTSMYIMVKLKPLEALIFFLLLLYFAMQSSHTHSYSNNNTIITTVCSYSFSVVCCQNALSCGIHFIEMNFLPLLIFLGLTIAFYIQILIFHPSFSLSLALTHTEINSTIFFLVSDDVFSYIYYCRHSRETAKAAAANAVMKRKWS